jgi:Spy/CpxP family protein refolding chaperone
MTKRQIFTGVTAAFLVTGIAAVEAQGRRAPAGPLTPRQAQGQMIGPRGGQMLGAPGRGFGGRGVNGRLGGAHMRRGPLAGLAAAGLNDDQKAKLKTILEAAEIERAAARAKTHDAIGGILTAEQKAKLNWK